jgi:glutathione peroxidase
MFKEKAVAVRVLFFCPRQTVRIGTSSNNMNAKSIHILLNAGVVAALAMLGPWCGAWLVGVAISMTTPSAWAAQAGCPAVLNHTHLRLQDEKPQDLCQYAGRVVLVVNTASYCGFTPQYKGLEALYSKYKSQGLVIIGFPSNDFSQEPDSNQKIADFCENTYGVKFPMMSKTSVRGSQAAPIFQQLAQKTETAPKWNFYKYLISRDGRDIKAFSSMTNPSDRDFVAQVERMLQQP